MATTKTPSIEELEAQLAAAKQAEAELNERRMRAQLEAEHTWYLGYVRNYDALEDSLMGREKEAQELARKAVLDGDHRWMTLWAEYRSIRHERASLRSIYQNAQTSTGVGQTKPDLTYYEADPFAWAAEILEREAALIAEERAQEKWDELHQVRQDAIATVK
ncbi:hypothetical protein F1721_07535 [Saccharopolyspora hirsuta]|uniref:Uncharacterized protein n=1 Tax=Saccharopolyspora hirsuta TaxID=1837 RepID=A0A5M7C340_SACHI|nr:hypothetical protein [Saccharopolyspora hirsuta]KAA5836173.1 hypothetical protein F1721_07535 [Saccharopolyspora hirsuta]